jgi:uncharacterized protein YcbK (DUF882 family)
MYASGKTSWCLWVASAMLLWMAPGGARAQSRAASSEQSLSNESRDHFLLLYNTHTAERIEIVYRHDDQYIPGALAKLDYFLRDHRTGDVRHFDPRVYDILSDLTPPESPRTACTFKRKPSTCACQASKRSSCARPLSLCVAAA